MQRTTLTLMRWRRLVVCGLLLTAVRYARANQPDANVIGRHGLWAAPFRTDDWPMIRPLAKWAPDLAERAKANKQLQEQLKQWRRERRIMAARKLLKDLDGR